MIIGYLSVSKDEIQDSHKIEKLKEMGCEKIYLDEKPQEIFENLNAGDTVIVPELVAISKNKKDLFFAFELFEKKNIKFKSLKEPEFDTTIHGSLIFKILLNISSFEKDCRKERLRRANKIGRPPIDPKIIERIRLTKEEKPHLSIEKICKTVRISPCSYYNHKRRYKNSG